MRFINAQSIPTEAVLIDIRDDLERSARPLLLESIAISLSELEDGSPALPLCPLVVVCNNGRQSEYAAALLEALGASQVLVLEGGMKSLNS